MTSPPLFSLPGDGQKITANGIELFIKATVQQINGLWSMVEYRLAPSLPGPGLHYHKKTEELFYILDGTLRFTLEGEIIDAPAGTLVVVPTGTRHKFENVSTDPVRFQVWFSPGGMEQYFVEVEQYIRNEPVWPPADKSRLLAVMNKHDMYTADQ